MKDLDDGGLERQGGKSKDDSVGDNKSDSWIEGKEASHQSARTHKESQWDGPGSGWHGKNDEKTLRTRSREWVDMPEPARDGKRAEGFIHTRVENHAEAVEDWDRCAVRRRDVKYEEDKVIHKHRSSIDGEDMADGRGRPAIKIQDEDDDYGDTKKSKEESSLEESDDRRRGWKSAKMGQGLKKSWSPNLPHRCKMDYDEFDREQFDERRDERGFKGEFGCDVDRHQDRKSDFHWERDRDFQNRENFHDEGNFVRDNTKDIEHWRHRQSSWYKGKEDLGDYNYEKDGWQVPRRDKGKAKKDHRSGKDNRENDQNDVPKSPQSMLSDTMERGAASNDIACDRGLGNKSPYMSQRGDSGGFLGKNGDADWMCDERSLQTESDDPERLFFDEEGGPLGLHQGFSRSSRKGDDGLMPYNMHNNRGRGPKGSPGRRGRAGAKGGDGRPPFANAKGLHQGGKGVRVRVGGKTGRVGARETQRVSGIPPPLLGPGLGLVPGPGPAMVPHFGGHMAPSSSIPVMGSNMGPGPIPAMGPGGFPPPPFGGPVGWGAGRGAGAGDMGMHPGPPGPGPLIHTPGAIPPRCGPNMGPGHGHDVYYPPAGPGRGAPNVTIAPPFGGWPENRAPPRVNAPAGLAPSRGEQNDYSQHFVDSGMRPQNFIRDVDLNDRFEEYPKLKELITRKDKLVTENACPPMYMQMDLKMTELSSEIFGTKFDVILLDPPWEEYVRRAPGVGDSMEWWTFEEILNLRIEAIADTPSFIFLWVGDAEGLDQGRLCLKKWGFRRCEDICWIKTNKENPAPALRHDSSTLLQHSKEHCLLGIRGTVRRSSDAHIIHANIDTDIIISEEPPYGSTVKPEEVYHIMEHFALGQRRLELFGEDHNIRAGWVTIGKMLTSSNFNAQTYCRYMGDADGKVWQGGRGNPPIDAPHLVGTTPEIEALRPKSPPPRAQQPSTSQPSAAHSNSKKVANVSPQNAQVSSSGPGQVLNSSSVIVINTSPSHSHHHSQGPSTSRGATPKHMRGAPLHLGIGPLVLAGGEDEKAMAGDGSHDMGSG